jgi:hypothetical protein
MFSINFIFKFFLKLCNELEPEPEQEPEPELEPYEENKELEPEPDREPCQNGTVLQHYAMERVY